MSHEKPTVLLEHYLKELKLPTFLREYRKIAELCGTDRTDYQTFLLRLVEREIQDREVRARERRIKAAKFPVLKTLDSFDVTAQPSINQSLIRKLMNGEYIDRKENGLQPPVNATHECGVIADRFPVFLPTVSGPAIIFRQSGVMTK